MPQTDVCADAPLEGYAFAYLDETTKRMIRRGLLKAVAIPRIRRGRPSADATKRPPTPPLRYGTGTVYVTVPVPTTRPSGRTGT